MNYRKLPQFSSSVTNRCILMTATFKVLSFDPIKQIYYFDEFLTGNQVELNTQVDNHETFELYLSIAGEPIFSSYIS